MVGNRSLRIALITDEGFPSGMATTNRILSLVKGMEIEGVKTKIYCVRSTENPDNIINKEYQGVVTENISFLYTNKTVIWPNNKLARLFSLISGQILFFSSFLKENNKNKYDILISTTRGYFPNLCYSILACVISLKVVLTIDEYPYVERDSQKFPKWFRSFYVSTFYKLFDGLVVMTNVLMNYYKSLVRDKTKLLHVPMTVEPERFQCPKLDNNEKYIAYCGNLGSNNKDGVLILIKAFHRIMTEFLDYKLFIIGGTRSSEKHEFYKLKNCVSELGMDNRVIFTGKINRDQIPQLLCKASILALARPKSLQADGGFPTKLGEYLATGNPVVVTKVGEIPMYLFDRQNAYLAEPDSVESFAAKLREAINDENSFKIGLEGKKLVSNTFNYIVQGKILFNFFKQLEIQKLNTLKR